MKKILVALSGVVLMGGVSAAAFAAEAQGRVTEYDESSKMLTLDNGETYTLGDNVADLQLHEGDNVKLMVEEQDGKMVVTEIENTEGAEMESGAEEQQENPQ